MKKVRMDNRKNPTPSYGLVDSQSAKTVAANEERGIDGGKTKGRKRHIVVDTMGKLLSVVVHAANVHDTKSGILPVRKALESSPTLQAFCSDRGYRGSFVMDVQNEFGMKVDISGFVK